MKIYVSRRALHKVRNLCLGVGVRIRRELPASPQDVDAALAGKPAPVGLGGKEFFLVEVGEDAEEKLLPLLASNLDPSDFVIVLDLVPPQMPTIVEMETPSISEEEVVFAEGAGGEEAQAFLAAEGEEPPPTKAEGASVSSMEESVSPSEVAGGGELTATPLAVEEVPAPPSSFGGEPEGSTVESSASKRTTSRKMRKGVS